MDRDKDKQDSEELEDPKDSEVLKPDPNESDPLDNEDEVDSDTPDTDDPFEEETEPEVEKQGEPARETVKKEDDISAGKPDFSEFGPIKRPTPSVSQDYAPRREETSMSWGQPLKTQSKSSNKKTILLIVVLLIMFVGGFF